MKRPLIAAALSILVSLIAVPFVYATDGVLTITQNTLLTETHHGTIVMGADEISLDCGLHTITGTQPGGALPHVDVCLDVTGRTKVTVSNCLIINCQVGVVVNGTKESTFIRNNVDGHDREGFEITDAENNFFGGNVMSLNGWNGMKFLHSNLNQLQGNDAHGNDGSGFRLVESNTNLFFSNIGQGNGVADCSQDEVSTLNHFFNNVFENPDQCFLRF